MEWPIRVTGAEAELFDGGLGVVDVRLAGVAGPSAGLSLWPWPRWSSATARCRSESQRAVAAQCEARPIRPCSNSTARGALGSSPLALGRVGELPGGEASRRRLRSRRCAAPCGQAPPSLHSVSVHAMHPSVRQTIEPLFENGGLAAQHPSFE